MLYQSRNKSIGIKKENLFVRKIIKIFYMAGDEKQASPLVHKIIRHTVTAINSINVSTFSGVRCPAASSFDGDTRNSTCVFVYRGVFTAYTNTARLWAADFPCAVLCLCNRSCTLHSTASPNRRRNLKNKCFPSHCLYHLEGKYSDISFC